MSILAVVFWIAVALLLYTHLGYPLVLAVAARTVRASPRRPSGATPTVSLIIAAYNEGQVIAAKVANARALQWPRERLEIIVCCDGAIDDTAQRARAAGADLVLDLPRSGKLRTQDAGVAAARGELLAFSDANSSWEPDALAKLAAAFEDPAVGYVCGQVRFVQAAQGREANNQEGLYWRYEMAVRANESRLRSVTAGNGAIYAVRREAYLIIDERMDHDLCFPFKLVKGGWLALYVPQARASEKMVPSIEGEFARKRRMWSHVWPMVLRGGMLAPRGYGLRYAWMMFSHRVLRYGAPALHVVALASNAALIGHGTIYLVCLLAQGTLVLAGLAGARVRSRPLLLARYYLFMNAALAAALWDYLRHGTPPAWETPEGTR